jgi:hypothetical protein
VSFAQQAVHGFRATQQRLATRRELDTGTTPLEQRRTELVLELRDCDRDARLRDIQCAGRAADGILATDSEESSMARVDHVVPFPAAKWVASHGCRARAAQAANGVGS